MLKFKFLNIKKSSIFSQQDESEIKLILSYLDAGLDYQQIRELLQTQHESLKSYTQQYYPTVRFDQLSQYFSYKDLLRFIFEIKTFNKHLKHKTLKIITYPLILYSLMYSLMLFFIFVLTPSLLNVIQLFEIDNPSLNLFSVILKYLFIGLTIFNSLVFILILIHKSDERKKLLFIRIKKHTILNDILTLQFAQFLNILIKHGFSTKQALDIMRQGSDNHLVRWIATLISFNLEEGKTFSDSINLTHLSSDFITMTQLGLINNQSQTLIQTYINTSKTKIEIKLNQFGNRLKLFTYTLLAVLIIFMYQILLAPMSLMNQF